VATGWQSGQYTCTCPSGYTGTYCQNWVNPCTSGGSNCAAGTSTCTSTGPGTFSCACISGYGGNGVTCTGTVFVFIHFDCDKGKHRTCFHSIPLTRSDQRLHRSWWWNEQLCRYWIDLHFPFPWRLHMCLQFWVQRQWYLLHW